MQEIIITGQTPSKKNAKRIVTNPKTKKPFIISSKIHNEWEKSALWQLKGIKPLENYPVSMTCIFYLKDKRRRDLSNMVQSVEDVLVKAGILQDDSWNLLSRVVLECRGVDPQPRVEVAFDPLRLLEDLEE